MKFVGNFLRADSQHAILTTITNVTIQAPKTKGGFLLIKRPVGSWNKNRATMPNVKIN